MNNPESRFLNTCPVGCNAPLEITAYVLPEGALLRCSACGQLISQCTEAHYWQSMQEFDDSQGTLPKAGSEGGRLRRSKKFLDQIAILLGQPPEKIRLLDVGCSSGAFLHAAVKLGFRAEGVEPAPKAAATAQAAGLKVHQGLLQEAGYADGQFDAVTIGFGLRNLPDHRAGLHEMRRVLVPGARLVVLEIAEPRTGLPRLLYLIWFRRAVPLLGRLLRGGGAYRYLSESLRAYPAPARVAELMNEVGLTDVRWRWLPSGMATLHVGRAPIAATVSTGGEAATPPRFARAFRPTATLTPTPT